MHRVFHWARGIKRPVSRILATSSVVFVIMPGPMAVAAFNSFAGEDVEDNSADLSTCNNDDSLQKLNALPRANMIAPFDYGPRILLLTPHNVLATSHHRNDSAMADQIRIFTSQSDISRTILAERNIRYIVACPDEVELELYAKRNPKGLWAQLNRGEKPGWLHPVHLRDTDLPIWRVVQKE